MESHLLQMRGLKHASVFFTISSKSHLLQMRGLKLYRPRLLPALCQVASFTDAWIETLGRGR